jgi:arabinosaccharide transport system substrate-binding protein
MAFPLGKPILVLAFLAAASGAWIWNLRGQDRADLVVWCFADSHARTYRQSTTRPDGSTLPSLAEQFERKTGQKVRINLISGRAENVRLVSLFMSQASGADLPDLCEIEIGSIGQFFRPPVQDVGFLPLNDFLTQSGQIGRILANRLAPWSKIDPRTGQRVIFGIPNDVHPMTITYRKDLFDEAGVDLQQAKTWAEFQRLCLAFQKYWTAHGYPQRRAMELRTTNPSDLLAMLLQRHINVVDSANRVHFTDDKTADTVAFYAQLVTGPDSIGEDQAPGIAWAHELSQGHVCALITADWRTGYLKKFAPELAGKLRMMPLPRFEESDAPTSTAGGTMMGIPRGSRHPEQAWKLLEFLYLSPQGLAARNAIGSDILPPIPAMWSDAIYQQPDPFFGGQKIGRLYADLARQIPPHDITPDTAQGELALTLVLRDAERYVDTRGTDGLTNACRTWLAQTQIDVQRRIDFGEIAP